MLRPYQADAVAQIKEHFKKGNRKVLLHLATGGGKTVVFSHIMQEVAKRAKRPIMIVRGRHLVDQASQRLQREGVYHGVMMAKHWNYQPIAPVQVCSIDTLIARGLQPPADLIVIDEAHMAISKGYADFIAQYDNPFILGVTATPFVQKSLRHVADVIVKPTTVQQLIDEGHLVAPRYYAPSAPDVSDVKISRATGDYDQHDLAEVMKSGGLVGDIVYHWKKLAANRPTICFAASVEHSKNIVEQFRAQGITAEHCEAETPDEERKAILERMRTGRTRIVSNVGILCIGVDMPYCSAIIMARPTKSYNLYIQQAGRGTRPFQDKSDFLLLDHAGNVLRHGFITEERDADLDGTEIKLEKTPKTCASCFAVFYGFACECGFVAPVADRPKETLIIDGDLNEITNMPIEMMILRDIERFKEIRKKKGMKPGWEYHQIRQKWGDDIALKHFPNRRNAKW